MMLALLKKVFSHARALRRQEKQAGFTKNNQVNFHHCCHLHYQLFCLRSFFSGVDIGKKVKVIS